MLARGGPGSEELVVGRTSMPSSAQHAGETSSPRCCDLSH